jgi:hypothetical protein
MGSRLLLFVGFMLVGVMSASAQTKLYQLSEDSKPRIISFENSTGAPGNGGKTNLGAKGSPNRLIDAGASVTLMDYSGVGIIQHIWLTVDHREPEVLRAMRIEMFWDGSDKPAVSAPVGDFFGTALSQRLPFECALFSDPEGRSCNCSIPMPFRKHARVVLTNGSKVRLNLYYAISFSAEKSLPKDAAYFHAFWHRSRTNPLGQDYEILPHVAGNGRFLGCNIGIITDPVYKDSWFGEGEVKMYLDGDSRFPTWNGTGTEDYIRSAWGQGVFLHSDSGCTLADDEHGRWAMYRFHLDDPIFFTKECRVTIQEMGSASTEDVRGMIAKHGAVIPVTVNTSKGLIPLLSGQNPPKLNDPLFPDGDVNFYRSDDYCSTAYFYLDQPSSGLAAMTDDK